MTHHQTNLGVRPLGGKHGTGNISPVVAAELALHAELLEAYSTLPPANSNENARLHRQVLVRFQPGLAKLFRELKLAV